MNQLDTYYRALREYRKETSADRDCDSANRALSKAASDKDRICVKRHLCRVEEDWIEAIEKGLVHVEKALKEERQFIQSNGEVIPIEKVKHVSKESVVHLAQHSNLIDREQTSDEIIPGSLFTVERLTDYTVYENKFLYLLLRYLQDFITLRYTNILSLTNRYEGNLNIDRTSFSRGRRLAYTVSLQEINENDPYLEAHNPCRRVLDRIDLILKAVLAFLDNPIMECCAKVAMIRPPITKTNVLRMNNNFRGAVQLYEYIVAYDKDGYTVETQETVLPILGEELNAGMSEAGLMSAFLMYEHGLGITADLKQECEDEDERRLHRELEAKSRQLEKLRNRLTNGEVDPYEYIWEQEKQRKQLEKEAAKVVPLRERIRELEAIEKSLREEVAELNRRIDGLRRELEETIQRYEKRISELTRQYEQKLAEQKAAYEQQLAEQKAAYEQQLAEQKEAYEQHLAEQKAAYEQQLADMQAAYEQRLADMQTSYEQQLAEQKASYEQQLADMQTSHEAAMKQLRDEEAAARRALEEQQEELNRQYAARIAEMTAEAEALNRRFEQVSSQYREEEEKRLAAEAQLLGLRSQRGDIKPDERYATEEEFDELERQYQAFQRFYEQNWRLAKKGIRRSLLSLTNLRRKDNASDPSVNSDHDGGNGNQ